jgi:hypothetical protein
MTRPERGAVRGGWKDRLAWRLRFWADKLDGWASYGVIVKASETIACEEWREAMVYGVWGMHAHLKAQLQDRLTEFEVVGDDGWDNRRRNAHD